MKLLTGKEPAAMLKEQVKQQIQTFWLEPKLAIVMIGEDEASKRYVKHKIKDCAEVGIETQLVELPAATTELRILSKIRELNMDSKVSGIIVQLPLPEHLNKQKILNAVAPEKDVDGLTTESIGQLYSGQPCFVPCTPLGIIKLLKYYGYNLDGKDVAIVGRSNLVGKPLMQLFLNENATPTIYHTHSVHPDKIREADIICLCAGNPGLLKLSDLCRVSSDAVVIDVGTTVVDGKLTGDLEVDMGDCECTNVAYTPVPGGIGLMTRAALLLNIIQAAIQQAIKKKPDVITYRKEVPNTHEPFWNPFVDGPTCRDSAAGEGETRPRGFRSSTVEETDARPE